MKRLTLAASFLGLALAACGGDDADDAASGGNGGTFEGTVAGQSLDVKEAVFTYVDTEGAAGRTRVLGVVLSSQTGLCARLKTNQQPGNLTTFSLGLFSVTGAAIAPGTFTSFSFASPVFVQAAFDRTDAQCESTLESGEGLGESGSVTLESFEAKAGGVARGAFDIKVGEQGDSVKGTFNATFCDVPVAEEPTDPVCG